MSEFDNLLATGVWILPLVIVFSLLALAVLVRYWQGKSATDLDNLYTALGELEVDYQDIYEYAQAFESETREPYARRAKVLVNQARRIRSSLNGMQDTYEQLTERCQQPRSSPFISFFGAPWLWFELRRDFRTANTSLTTLTKDVAHAQETIRSLQEINLQISGVARFCQTGVNQNMERLNRLAKQNVGGNDFFQAVQATETHHRDFQGVPSVFLAQDEAEILAIEDADLVIDTHKILTRLRPEIEAVTRRIADWEQCYQQICTQLTQLENRFADLSQKLAQATATLDLSSLEQKCAVLHDHFGMIASQAGMPDVSRFDLIREQLSEVDTALNNLSEQHQSAQVTYSQLSRNLNALRRLLEKVEQEIQAGAQNQQIAIVWGLSQHRYSVLHKKISQLGDQKKRRTPEVLTAEATRSAEVLEELNALQLGLLDARKFQDRMIDILHHDKLENAEVLLNQSNQLGEKIARFDPKNWERAVNLSDFPGRVQQLHSDFGLIQPVLISRQIKEQDLENSAGQLGQFAAALQNLRQQYLAIESQLIHLEEQHAQLVTLLELIGGWLQRMSAFISKTSHADTALSADLVAYQKKYYSLHQELNQTTSGLVAAKSRQIHGFHADLLKSTIKWAQNFQTACQDLLKEIDALLLALEQISVLDEPALHQARKFLAEQTLPTLAAQTDLLTLEHSFQALSQVWEPGLRVYRDLEDLHDLVVVAHQDARQQRDTTLALHSDARSLVPEKRSWPGTTMNISSHNTRIAELEARWKRLSSESTRSGWYVKKISDLQRDYSSLENELSKVIRQANAEITQVTEADQQLTEFLDRWQVLSRRSDLSGDTRDKIRYELSRARNARLEIEQNYTRGALDYDAALKSLRLLTQQVEKLRIPLGNSDYLDLSSG